jgi:hypothetical protein
MQAVTIQNWMSVVGKGERGVGVGLVGVVVEGVSWARVGEKMAREAWEH